MFQTLKRLFLVLMTLVAVNTMVGSLVASWQQPQIQSRLELYQINLLLQASQWQPPTSTTGLDASKNWQQFRGVILGEEPIKIAQEQYQNARQADQKILEDLTNPLSKLENNQSNQAEKSEESLELSSPSDKIIAQLQEVIPQLDMALGILDMELGNKQAARDIWQGLINAPVNSSSSSATKLNRTTQEIAKILLNLWSDSPQSEPKLTSKSTSKLIPKSLGWEDTIKTSLSSWFRNRTLHRLYILENSLGKLKTLQQQENAQAENAVWRLLALTLIPSISGILGLGILIFLGGRAFIRSQLNPEVGSQVGSGVINNQAVKKDLIVPWDGETIWEVLVGGFFFVGQLLIPYLFSNLPLGNLNLDVRGKAIAVLSSYLFMSVGTLAVLYFALRRFLPLPPGWFPIKWRGNWFLWGLGGYLVAIPLVISISLVNQVIWQGKGGSNPILPLALQGNDLWSFVIFATTASVAAPIFEEIIFRGFLLPSLTRYLPVWGAIALSSLLFAIAHLSLSEVLPLTVLGMVLGVVYWQCSSGEELAPKGNLLASMLLHSLWNGGTLISLYILSSGGN